MDKLNILFSLKKYTELILNKLKEDYEFVFGNSKNDFEDFKPLQKKKEEFATEDKTVKKDTPIADVRKIIEDCNIWKTKVSNSIKDNYNPNIMLIDSKSVKDEFNKYLDEYKKIYEDFLGNSYREIKKEIDEIVETAKGKINTEHNTIEKICKFIE